MLLGQFHLTTVCYSNRMLGEVRYTPDYSTYDDVITNTRWRTDAILKMFLVLYLGAILADYCEIRMKNPHFA